MLITEPYATAEEHIQLVREIIGLVDNLAKDSEPFHDLLRSLPAQYFNEWVAGQAYAQGDIYTRKGVKYLVIKDTPSTVTNAPELAAMREYSLAFNGMYPHLWAFKEPVREGMLRTLYDSPDTYRAKRNAAADENLFVPNENPDLWEIVPAENPDLP